MVEEHESELVGLAHRALAKHFDNCRTSFQHVRLRLVFNEFLYKLFEFAGSNKVRGDHMSGEVGNRDEPEFRKLRKASRAAQKV